MKIRFGVLFFFALVLSGMQAHAAMGDTTIVKLLSKFTFPGQPTNVDTTVVVPPKQWARAVLKLKLECPCAPLQGEWDYTNTYYIRVPTGKKDSLGKMIYDDIEIARFITPYWKYQPAGSNYTWWWDITDYAYLMKDTTRFSVHYDGWSSSASFSVWVEYIEGTAPYDVFGIDKLWQTSFLYGNMKDPIEPHVTNKKFRAPESSAFTKLKITNTGHGGYTRAAIAEFTDKTHHIAINGTNRFTQHLWRTDCGSNPYYPQDGTWALQRAGWCPGDVVPTWEWDISPYLSKADSTRLDYNMEHFEVDSACNGIYSIAAQVMYAHSPNFKNDASLEEILAPNVSTPKTRYSRMNPICGNPVVRIRNNGGATLTSVTFEYGVVGETPMTYTWNGSVPMMSTQDITLPAPSWTKAFAASSRQFTCRITKTNGVDDEYPLFNSLTSTFSVPPTYEGDIQINFHSNKYAADQGYFWTLKNASDSLIASRDAGAIQDETTYNDSLHLSPGCYTLQWVNPSSYGLAWWVTVSDFGSATLNMTGHNSTLQTFGGDCGNGVYQQFMVGILPHIKILDNKDMLSIGPVALGDSLRKTISVGPTNSAPLTITKASLTALAKGFSLVGTNPVVPTGKGLILNEGERMDITVQYKPQNAGRKAASVTIECNDIYSPSFNIPVSGYDLSTGVDDEQTLPKLQVVPTSTDRTARILFDAEVLRSDNARCALYDQLGREVRVLFDNAVRPLSTNEINSDVSQLPPGVYYVVLHVGKQVASAPLIVTR